MPGFYRVSAVVTISPKRSWSLEHETLNLEVVVSSPALDVFFLGAIA